MSNTLNILQHILFISRFGKKKNLFLQVFAEKEQMLLMSLYWRFKLSFSGTPFLSNVRVITLFDDIYCRILQSVLLTTILFLSIVYIIARKICKERKFEQIERMRDTVAVDQRVRVRTNRHFARKPVTTLKVTLLHWCFSRFLNCANGTKSRKVGDIIY